MSIKNSGFMEKNLFKVYFKVLSQKLTSKIESYKNIEEKIIQSFCIDFLMDKINYYEDINLNQTLKTRIIGIFKDKRIFTFYLKLKNLKKKKIEFNESDNKNFAIIENFLKK